jgi:hypothetical protein
MCTWDVVAVVFDFVKPLVALSALGTSMLLAGA